MDNYLLHMSQADLVNSVLTVKGTWYIWYLVHHFYNGAEASFVTSCLHSAHQVPSKKEFHSTSPPDSILFPFRVCPFFRLEGKPSLMDLSPLMSISLKLMCICQQINTEPPARIIQSSCVSALSLIIFGNITYGLNHAKTRRWTYTHSAVNMRSRISAFTTCVRVSSRFYFCDMCTLRSDCAFAQSDLSLRISYLLKETFLPGLVQLFRNYAACCIITLQCHWGLHKLFWYFVFLEYYLRKTRLLNLMLLSQNSNNSKTPFSDIVSGLINVMTVLLFRACNGQKKDQRPHDYYIGTQYVQLEIKFE